MTKAVSSSIASIHTPQVLNITVPRLSSHFRIHYFIYKLVLLRRGKIRNNNLNNFRSSSLTHPAGRWLWTVLWLWWHLSIILAKQLLEQCLWNTTSSRISENTNLHKVTVQTQCETSNGVLRMASYACSEQLYNLWCSLEHPSLPLDKTTWHTVSVHRQNEGHLLWIHQATRPVQLLDYPWTSEVNWVLFSAMTAILLHFIQAGYGTLPVF